MPPGSSHRTQRLTPSALPVPSSGGTNLLDPPAPAGPSDLTLVGGPVAALGSTPLPSLDRFPHIPGYTLQCEVGRGGMGVVYRATQDRLNRAVAIKTLLHHHSADPADVVRFRSEAEAVAAIAHPNVVKVFESGQHDGRSYFAMEYLPGGSLHAKLRAHGAFTPDAAAGLVEKLARAVHSAHSIGIVHRDLKPGNVLFDASGEPRVTDFGLAKRTACELTKTQAVMGTPAYMPPEQAAGRAKYVGPPADIYALGVIMYECLTGTTPFAGDDSLAMLNQVIADEPPSIRAKVPTVPRDLELICLKCLEKGPADRYQTAAELADDLRRYSNREPVSVRPAGLIEKAVKWARRRPTLATAYGLGVLVAALAVFGGGAAVLAVQTAWARDDANRHWRATEVVRDQLKQQAEELERARATADEHRMTAEKARDALQDKHEEVGTALAGERKAKDALEKEHKELVAVREELERGRYFRNVVFAQKEAEDGNYPRAIALLDDCPPARRGWEWWHAYRTVHKEVASGVAGGVYAREVAFNGNGIDLITAHHDGCVTRFDFRVGKGTQARVCPENTTVGLSADGKRAVAVRAWSAAFDDGVSVWDLAAGKRVAAFPVPHACCRMYRLSPDGKRVIFQYDGEPVRGYEVDGGKELSRVDVTAELFVVPALSADGGVAVASTGAEAVEWQVGTGKTTRRLRCEGGRVTAVGVSPSGKLAATGSSTGEVRFHPTGGKAVGVRRAHVGAVTVMAFSPDGTRASTAGDDGAVKVWDPSTGKLLHRFQGHMLGVTALAFHPDGSKVASTDEGGGFRVWEIKWPVASSYRLPIGAHMKGLFATDTELTRLFAADADESAVEWLVKPNTEHRVTAPKGQRFTAVALHPTSPQKALGVSGGNVYLQADPAAEPQLIHSFDDEVRRLRYSADGGRVLGAAVGKFVVWESATGKEVGGGHLEEGAEPVLAISPDGKRVALVAVRRNVQVFDLATQQVQTYTLAEEVSEVGFAPDGKGLVVGTRRWGLTVIPFTTPQDRVLTAADGKRYVGHTSPVTCFGYSPDGKRVVAGATDGSVRVWDAASGHEAIAMTVGTTGAVRAVWFTADGKKLVAVPEDGPPVVYDGSPRQLAFRPEKPLPAEK